MHLRHLYATVVMTCWHVAGVYWNFKILCRRYEAKTKICVVDMNARKVVVFLWIKGIFVTIAMEVFCGVLRVIVRGKNIHWRCHVSHEMKSVLTCFALVVGAFVKVLGLGNAVNSVLKMCLNMPLYLACDVHCDYISAEAFAGLRSLQNSNWTTSCSKCFYLVKVLPVP